MDDQHQQSTYYESDAWAKKYEEFANDRVTLYMDRINTSTNFLDDHFETETLLLSYC